MNRLCRCSLIPQAQYTQRSERNKTLDFTVLLHVSYISCGGLRNWSWFLWDGGMSRFLRCALSNNTCNMYWNIMQDTVFWKKVGLYVVSDFEAYESYFVSDFDIYMTHFNSDFKVYDSFWFRLRSIWLIVIWTLKHMTHFVSDFETYDSF